MEDKQRTAKEYERIAAEKIASGEKTIKLQSYIQNITRNQRNKKRPDTSKANKKS